MPYSGTTSYIVRIGDLPALRARVEELADQDQITAERLLGQLAHLEAAHFDRDGRETVDFTPPTGCEDLAQRAVAQLYSAPFGRGRGRGRFRRAS